MLVDIGFGVLVERSRVLVILPYDTAATRRLHDRALASSKAESTPTSYIDATRTGVEPGAKRHSRRRALLILDNGTVLVSPVRPSTLAARLDAQPFDFTSG